MLIGEYCHLNLAIQCVEIGTVHHANRKITGNGYNSRVEYICHSSYRLLRSAVRTCDKTSTWTGDQPLCVRKLLLISFHFSFN